MRRTVRPTAPSLRQGRARFESLESRTLLAAQPDELTIRAEADAHVRDGIYAGTNFGDAPELEVNPSNVAGSRRDGYLRFNLADVTDVGSATLRVFGRLDAGAATNVEAPFVVMTSSDETWSETGVTWNAPIPSNGGNLTVRPMSAEARWYEVDLSAAVDRLVDLGRDAVSLIVRGFSSTDATFRFSSDEGANPPQLIVRRDPPAVAPAIVVVTPYRDAHEGGEIYFDVGLATKPAADVVITMTKDAGAGDASFAGATESLTLTAEHWYRGGTFRVDALDDADASNAWATFTLSAPGAQPVTVTGGSIDSDTPVLPSRGLRAAADAYVRSASYADTNFGQATSLEVRNSGVTTSNRKAYIKFVLTDVKTFQRAKLRVFGAMEDNAPDQYLTLNVRTATGAWTESTITWNGQPAIAATGTGELRMTRGAPPQWFEHDVTHFLLGQKAGGATSVTFVLDVSFRTSLARFNSDEAATNQPELVLTNFEAAGSTDPSPPSPGPAPMVLTSGPDAYVRDGSHAGTNFGSATQLQVKRGATGYNRESYLAFTLPAMTDVSSATLRLYGKLDNTTAPSIAFQAYSSPDKLWSEYGVTWNSRLAVEATPVFTGTVVGTTGKWYEFDVTDFVQAQDVGNGEDLSFVLRTSVASSATIQFDSRQGVNRPELVITRGNVGTTPQSLIVSSSSLAVPEGGAASFDVRLAAKPDADVPVTVARSAAGDGDIGPAADVALLFTPDNWAVAQSVQLSAAPDDDAVNGSAVYTVSSAGLGSKTVTATEVDDDQVNVPGPLPLLLRATADAYVRDGTHAGTKFGAASQLQVKKGAAGWNRDSYLRFDISGAASVGSAKLRLFGALDNTQNAGVGFDVYAANDTSWSETSVTWNSRPVVGQTVHAAGTVTGTTGKWYELDLTTLIAGNRASGRTAVTLVIRGRASSNSTILFNSDEAANNRPELVIVP